MYNTASNYRFSYHFSLQHYACTHYITHCHESELAAADAQKEQLQVQLQQVNFNTLNIGIHTIACFRRIAEGTTCGIYIDRAMN
jgi:hypothetical protein